MLFTVSLARVYTLTLLFNLNLRSSGLLASASSGAHSNAKGSFFATGDRGRARSTAHPQEAISMVPIQVLHEVQVHSEGVSSEVLASSPSVLLYDGGCFFDRVEMTTRLTEGSTSPTMRTVRMKKHRPTGAQYRSLSCAILYPALFLLVMSTSA